MRPAVLPGFMKLTDSFEGGQQTNHMYLCIGGYVTTAFGVLIDSVRDALALPWVRLDGSPASPSEVTAAWNIVKSHQNMRMGGGMAFRRLTSLRLTEAGVQFAIGRKLALAETSMRARFPDWDDYGADAQLFALSMCWAIGGGWPAKFPRCAAAFARRDFLAAAQEAHIQDEDDPKTLQDESNPGITPRNEANVVLLRNASVVQTGKLHPDRLWWPRDIWEEPLPLEDDTLDEDDATKRSAITWETVTRLPGSIANDDDDPPEAA
jgi:hypothetical protein